jgi:predicted alpha/beta-hydrolase family hydrolase
LPASNSVVLKVQVSEQVAVTAKVEMPASIGSETPVVILAHGANNDLDHPLLVAVTRRLAAGAGAMAVRFNFPYMERGSSSPDAAPVLENCFRRVHDHVADELAAPGAPLFIGGKSLGGRTAAELLSRGEEGEGLVAAGLVELGYPLHRPGHKETLNSEPLRKIGVPSLFVIGEKDVFCDLDLLRPLLAQLLHPGKLVVVPGGDHSLHRSGAAKAAAVAGAEGDIEAAADPTAEFAEVAAEVARFVTEIAGGLPAR